MLGLGQVRLRLSLSLIWLSLVEIGWVGLRQDKMRQGQARSYQVGLGRWGQDGVRLLG